MHAGQAETDSGSDDHNVLISYDDLNTLPSIINDDLTFAAHDTPPGRCRPHKSGRPPENKNRRRLAWASASKAVLRRGVSAGATPLPSTRLKKESRHQFVHCWNHSFTRYSARSSSSSSFAPLGRFSSWPRPDSIRYAVSAPNAAPSAASFLSLSFTPFTAPAAAPAAAASAASC